MPTWTYEFITDAMEDFELTIRSTCLVLQEESGIEEKVLRAGKAVGVAVVQLKKKSGKIIAQARYSKYLGASSKL
jgi:hypothetical protein